MKVNTMTACRALLDLLQKSLINTGTADKKQMNTDKRR